MSETTDDLIQHFKECDCHDSWDQCPCADGGHPADGSCNCCPRGTGLCGPLPTASDQGDEAELLAEIKRLRAVIAAVEALVPTRGDAGPLRCGDNHGLSYASGNLLRAALPKATE